jgi:hypothetical protein
LTKPSYEIIDKVIEIIEKTDFQGMRRLFITSKLIECIYEDWHENLTETWPRFI